MNSNVLEINNASAEYNTESKLAWITYRGLLDSDVTIEVYAWLEYLYRRVGSNGFHGQVFDFRQVEEFGASNLKTARRVSNRINMIIDTSRIPVALLVANNYHEEMLLSPMRVSPQNIRKKIVWSEKEALAFIDAKNLEFERNVFETAS